MKKIVLLLLSLFLIFTYCGASKALSEGFLPDYLVSPEDAFSVSDNSSEVCMILAALRKQPHPTFTTNKDNLDTVWIFFNNGEFLQYVTMDQELRLFSCGTYSPITDEELDIHRTGKYMEGAGFGPYRSVHPYILHIDEYVLLFAGQKEVPQF